MRVRINFQAEDGSLIASGSSIKGIFSVNQQLPIGRVPRNLQPGDMVCISSEDSVKKIIMISGQVRQAIDTFRGFEVIVDGDVFFDGSKVNHAKFTTQDFAVETIG